ncbi:family 20 glycosylhydrolase [Streptomyces sp. MUM 203J]|uniref:beta-N-acetylhexosaminidase n=1 Tax=Streptomyces sp. MUM 203J TaxID=2791990 RepID=UPI001F041990|nr:glycoside hydrolase family 20 protein [Streptomyces sp. MUM 203J]MCH0539366.1 family 20 glycosylhydrolase [Streptomyces sp. MUM 203J]
MAVTLALSGGLAGCGGDGDGGTAPTAATRPRTAPTPSPSLRPGSPTPPGTPTPAPTRTHPPSVPPLTIPAVREHAAARGPGWRPEPGRAVVVAPGSGVLDDEARLLARELGLDHRGETPARAGDIELALDTRQGGGPESYALVVRDGRVRISGPDEAGVFYGTRTVKQAVRSGGAVPEGVIRDRPDRPQRGLMVDIARKHFTAAWLEDRIREMADLKLNQLGLHFSDDQAFRIESTSHPEVVSSPHLTKAEVRRIIALADSLHVTVIPEIDSPGHLGAVLAAHPALRLRSAAGTMPRGAIDIANPASARLVDDLLREYAELFTGPYFHVGADEYAALMARDPDAAYPALAAEARRRYGAGAGVQDLATGWLNDRAAVVRTAGKQPKAWNDGFFRGGVVRADQGIEVEYWTGREIGARPPSEYLAEGRTVVNVNDRYLYYVLGEPNQFTYPTGREIYEAWNPLVLRGTSPVPSRYSSRIAGARFAVWCDLANAQTQAQVAAGIRLPLRALAQRVWDPRSPQLSWQAFTELAGRVAGPSGGAPSGGV